MNLQIGETSFVIPNVGVCATVWQKFRGLMFRRRHGAPALLFRFSTSADTGMKRAFHSLFCFFPFVAVWLDADGCVVDVQYVRPFRLYVVPHLSTEEDTFRDVLELPLNNAYGPDAKQILDLSTRIPHREKI